MSLDDPYFVNQIHHHNRNIEQTFHDEKKVNALESELRDTFPEYFQRDGV